MTPETLDLEPPEGLLEVAGTLEEHGHEAWAVGGAVRDALLGHPRGDWDLATAARPPEVQAIFPRTVPVGIEHGTVGVLGPDEVMYEVTTFRHDVETDGRHARVRFSDTIEEDLARRDFTINAVAWRPATGELRDPCGGRDDLRERVLRAVRDPAERFAEDYLRVLRGLRFAGRYRMEVEEKTRDALGEAVPGIEDLSAERIREELMKVLADPRPSEALRLYREFGVLGVWYPEVGRAADRDPRWEINLAAVDQVARGRDLVRLVRWILPSAGEGEEGLEAPRALLERLKFSNRATRRALHLVERYDPLPGPMDSDAELRSWLAEVGAGHVRDVLRLHIAWARASAAEEGARYLVFLWERLHEELLSGAPLDVTGLAVDGRDLMELGVQEGPYVGLLLQELHAQVLENPALNRREELLELAGELIEMGHLRGPEAGAPPSQGDGGPSADELRELARGLLSEEVDVEDLQEGEGGSPPSGEGRDE